MQQPGLKAIISVVLRPRSCLAPLSHFRYRSATRVDTLGGNAVGSGFRLERRFRRLGTTVLRRSKYKRKEMP